MGFIKEFREFALKGNMLDLAVGVIISRAQVRRHRQLADQGHHHAGGRHREENVDFSEAKVLLKAKDPANDKSADIL